MATIELLGEHLEDRPRDRLVVVHLPEVRRTTPVAAVVAVVVGPDAFARSGQDAAAQDAEPKPQDYVELLAADRSEVGVGEPLFERPWALGDNRDGRDARQRLR